MYNNYISCLYNQFISDYTNMIHHYFFTLTKMLFIFVMFYVYNISLKLFFLT